MYYEFYNIFLEKVMFRFLFVIIVLLLAIYGVLRIFSPLQQANTQTLSFDEYYIAALERNG